MRLRHLEVVNAIRIMGTLSGAARLLHMTQPAVTQILQSAEKQLGYDLFRRTRGRLEPTAEALVIFPELESLDRQVVKLQQLTANLQSGEASQLRVLASPALAQSVMPQILTRFLRKHPDARVVVRTEYSSKVIADLALREADIGLVFDSERHPAIEFVPLADIPLVAVGPRGSFRAGQPIALDALLAKPLVAPDTTDPIWRVLSQTCEQHGWPLHSRLSIKLYQAAMAAAASGLGVTVVDAWTARSADHAILDVAPIRPLLTVPVGVVRAATASQSGFASDFIAFCRDVLSS